MVIQEVIHGTLFRQRNSWGTHIVGQSLPIHPLLLTLNLLAHLNQIKQVV